VSLLDQLTRAQAASLLKEARAVAALADLLEEQMCSEVGQVHPLTMERLQRARTLQTCIERLLTARAGPAAREMPPDQIRRP